uniref:Uncharacterized protein n=1 Tax=Timema shepardi TaxID=629360 RepID=A0A7R9B0F8_TIMSH|nr:unnamed protein product [Timema shepardi]
MSRVDRGEGFCNCSKLRVMGIGFSSRVNSEPNEIQVVLTIHVIFKEEKANDTLVRSWGTCYVAGGCGEGRRERQVRCSDPEGRTVLELMCDPITAPLKIKLCFTACRHHRVYDSEAD